MCRFNAPWVPSDERGIVHSVAMMDEAKAKQSKKVIDKVLFYIVTMICLISHYQKFRKTMELQRNNITMY